MERRVSLGDGISLGVKSGMLPEDSVAVEGVIGGDKGREAMAAERAREAMEMPLEIDRGWVMSGIGDDEEVYLEALDGIEEGEALVFVGSGPGDREGTYYLDGVGVYKIGPDGAQRIDHLRDGRGYLRDFYASVAELWHQSDGMVLADWPRDAGRDLRRGMGFDVN